MSKTICSTLASKKSEISDRHAELKSWSLVALEYPGVKRGTLQRFASSDYDPKLPALRQALGLPIMGRGEVCPVHGVVHAKTCRVVPEWVSAAADWLRARERH